LRYGADLLATLGVKPDHAFYFYGRLSGRCGEYGNSGNVCCCSIALAAGNVLGWPPGEALDGSPCAVSGCWHGYCWAETVSSYDWAGFFLAEPAPFVFQRQAVASSWSKSHFSTAATAPTLQVATQNLSATIGDQLGVKVVPQEILKAVVGPGMRSSAASKQDPGNNE
jgi:hypothetical protein